MRGETMFLREIIVFRRSTAAAGRQQLVTTAAVLLKSTTTTINCPHWIDAFTEIEGERTEIFSVSSSYRNCCCGCCRQPEKQYASSVFVFGLLSTLAQKKTMFLKNMVSPRIYLKDIRRILRRWARKSRSQRAAKNVAAACFVEGIRRTTNRSGGRHRASLLFRRASWFCGEKGRVMMSSRHSTVIRREDNDGVIVNLVHP